jgi:hypothetical protein
MECSSMRTHVVYSSMRTDMEYVVACGQIHSTVISHREKRILTRSNEEKKEIFFLLFREILAG